MRRNAIIPMAAAVIGATVAAWRATPGAIESLEAIPIGTEPLDAEPLGGGGRPERSCCRTGRSSSTMRSRT